LSEELTDNDYEDVLDDEELRLNRDSKRFHRIYNIMPFPEPKDRASRTITAAETRVSRESLIVEDAGKYRRLSLRERATLQGFPITYQFYGKSYSDRQKMIGNAIPPLLTYLIGRAITDVPAEIVHEVPYDYRHELPLGLPTRAKKRVAAQKYRWGRRFRSAIPHLRFGSGVRFELANEFEDGKVRWCVSFFYGGSKNYRKVTPDEDLIGKLYPAFGDSSLDVIADERHRLRKTLSALNPSDVQNVWNHSRDSGTGPFDVVDALGDTVVRLLDRCEQLDAEVGESTVLDVINGDSGWYESFLSRKKGKEINLNVLAGLLVGGWFNES
jgi:DNA (cytosine-5)-methyltransferase 1